MHTTFEEQVRERAYQIWLAAGMAEGMAHEHWVSAEQAVANEDTMANVRPETSAMKTMTAGASSSSTKPPKAKKAERRMTSKAAKAKH